MDILENWQQFIKNLPHQQTPFSKKNWGNPNHSLCSYQGKLKPSIAYHLVSSVCPSGGRILDPFAGVGTIPFECALNGIQSFGMDISKMCYYISQAKVGETDINKAFLCIEALDNYIKTHQVASNKMKKYA